MIIHENDFLKPYGITIHGMIEVGAHYAEEYWGMSNDGVDNFVFFEPVPDTYEKMVSCLPSSDGIKTYNMALGNYTGTVPMFVESAHQGKSCSILKPLLHRVVYPDIDFNEQAIVPIDRLDNIELDMSLYNMLQTDTQGYDLEVLKGASETIKHMDFIKVEVHREELYKGAASVDDIDSHLTEFERIYTYWMGTWGDAYYIRKK